MATKTDILKILGVLTAAYPNFNFTKEAAQVYCELLSDLDREALELAAKQCATGGEFFPTVYALRKAAVEIALKAQGVPSAFAAWDELIHMPGSMERKELTNETAEDGRVIVNVYQLHFTHPLIEKVARALGWPGRFLNGENDMADRAHFFKAYESALTETRDDARMLPEVKDYVENLRAVRQIEELSNQKQLKG